eukprot:765019-Hanusia_phi.AAC.1
MRDTQSLSGLSMCPALSHRTSAAEPVEPSFRHQKFDAMLRCRLRQTGGKWSSREGNQQWRPACSMMVSVFVPVHFD